MINLSRRHFIQVAGAAASLPLLGKGVSAANPLKVGFIYVGPINDGGWNTAHEKGRQAMMKALGDKITSTYVANVPETPDAARVMTDLVNQGCKLIYATSFGFMDSTVKVARKFPDVTFEMCTGYKDAHNLANYNIRYHQGRSVEGTIAGMLTKTNVGGYLGTYPIPEVIAGIDSFTLAAQKVNPKFKTKFIMIDTWFNPAKEADAARALIDQGCDVMAQHTDSPAAVQVCEQRSIPTFGQDSDQSQFAPTMCKTSSVDTWAPFYIKLTQEKLDGTWKPQDHYWGLKEGALVMAPITHVPDNVKEAGENVIKGWDDGSYNVFAGPIKDQTGKVRLEAGKAFTDAEILGLNWLVEGVQGKLS